MVCGFIWLKQLDGTFQKLSTLELDWSDCWCLGQEMLQKFKICIGVWHRLSYISTIPIKLSSDIGSPEDWWWRRLVAGPNSSGRVQTEKMQLTRSSQNNADHSNCSLLHHPCCNAIHRLQFKDMKNHHEHRRESFQFLNAEKVLNWWTFRHNIQASWRVQRKRFHEYDGTVLMFFYHHVC